MKILIGAYFIAYMFQTTCANQNFHICRLSKVLLQGKNQKKIGRIPEPKTVIPSKCMASAVYKRIFDDVFMMTSAEKRIRSSLFALYSGENTSDVTLWGLVGVRVHGWQKNSSSVSSVKVQYSSYSSSSLLIIRKPSTSQVPSD